MNFAQRLHSFDVITGCEGRWLTRAVSPTSRQLVGLERSLGTVDAAWCDTMR